MLRTEAGHALIASSVYNAAGAKKRDGSLFTPLDFMPYMRDEEEQSASPQQVLSLFVSISKAKRTDH